jgi:hypothetical protein
MAGRMSQRKGRRGEQDAVNALKAMGVSARRTAPLQAGMGRQSYAADVAWGPDHKYTAECKTLANGFASVYNALGGADLLIIKADRRERLYVIPESMARCLLPLLEE